MTPPTGDPRIERQLGNNRCRQTKEDPDGGRQPSRNTLVDKDDQKPMANRLTECSHQRRVLLDEIGSCDKHDGQWPKPNANAQRQKRDIFSSPGRSRRDKQISNAAPSRVPLRTKSLGFDSGNNRSILDDFRYRGQQSRPRFARVCSRI